MTEKPSHNDTNTPTTPARAALTFDAQAYTRFLDDCDWTPEQKQEFVEAVWQIVVGVIDLQFGTHPIQLVMDSPKVLDVDSDAVLAFDEYSEIKETRDAATSMAGAVGREDS